MKGIAVNSWADCGRRVVYGVPGTRNYLLLISVAFLAGDKKGH